MPRGGARKGSGPKKGAKYSKRFKLQPAVAVDPTKKVSSSSEKMALLRRQVVLCVADDMPPAKIAVVLGISEDRLNALFSHELAHGREIVRAEELLRLDIASGGGKVAATKAILQRSDMPSTKAPGSRDLPHPTDGLHKAALKILQGGKP